jgi:2-keto-3-deoxy-6-phosphogluconate aldolase
MVAAADVLGEFARLGVIPVVVLDDPAEAAPLAEILSAARLPPADVSLRTSSGEEAISVMAQWPDLLVGAGTALDASQAERVAAAGARFVVSAGRQAGQDRESRGRPRALGGEGLQDQRPSRNT